MALAAISALKGDRPVVLEVATLTDMMDHMIIVGGSSGRHVRAVVDGVLDAARAHGVAVVGVEGHSPGDWVLIDLGVVVVHVMRESARAFYDLEGLWDVGPVACGADSQAVAGGQPAGSMPPAPPRG